MRSILARSGMGVLALLTIVLMTTSASGAFVDGNDFFNGTSLDLQNWSTSTANSGTTFSQSNGLTIHSYGATPPYPWGGYTTTSPLISVGGSVWAQVRVNNANTISSPTTATLALDTDPHGVNSYQHDSTLLDLFADFAPTSNFQGVYAGERQIINGTSGGNGGPAVTTSQLPLATTYIFQIERLSSSNVRFSLFSETGLTADGKVGIQLVGSNNRTSVTSSANMYVSLQSAGTDVTFLNATINHPLDLAQASVLPEPDVALIGLMLIALNRRRSHRR